MQVSKAVCSLIFLLVTGCASSQGFDRASMEEALHVSPPPIPEGQSPENQDARLSLPLRLGIFFADHSFPNRQSIRKVEWLTTDREQLLHQLAPLRDEHILGDTFVLMDATLRGENILGIRRAGARYGADLVLIVDGAAAVDRYNNGYAWLYPTLIGAYLAPGTESAALVIVTGSLWETRSDWHAPNQTAEGLAKSIGSAVFTEDNRVIEQAKKTATEVLTKRLIDQLHLIKEGLARAKSDLR
jgi:hypothetical protein